MANSGAHAALPRALRDTTAGERQTLEAFLDMYRDLVRGKLAGLSDEDGRRRLVPSGTTLAGLVKHLALVERNWFVDHLRGRGGAVADELADRDTSFDLGPDDTVAGLLDRYEQACALSRRTAAGFDLDHTVPQRELGRVSLRWIYLHMIEETARHAGHADILREQTDGRTGWFA